MNLLISFSGGESSALMTYKILNELHQMNGGLADRYENVLVVFANTGEENEQTLEFVDECDKRFGFNTVWVEAVVHPEKGVGTTHRIVTFETASRSGEPYEDVIKKYGIPNKNYPHCTRELKTAPIYSYIRSVGWSLGTFDVAIGIRIDEIKRKDKAAHLKGLIYPLCDWEPITKRDVNIFWSRQPFRLRLTGYQGNCKWCWKKSYRKLLTIMDESPDKFLFPERMEQYGAVNQSATHGPRRFFRGHKTVQDLRAMHEAGDWERAMDDSLDIDEGCVESCEIEWKGVIDAVHSPDHNLDEPMQMVQGTEK